MSPSKDEARVDELVHNLAASLDRRGWSLAVAESCTGGGLGARITEIPGSSSYFVGGIIAYQNRIKMDELGVPERLLTEHGAVSQQVAEAMARGCLRRFSADLAVAITGIAGPEGGSLDKPVGLVYLAAAVHDLVLSRHHHFAGGRSSVRAQAVEAALRLALDALHDPDSTEARIP
jgi:PncC family amidohydrolase